MGKLTRKWRKTADGLSPTCKGILAQSFSCKKLGNEKPTANTVRNAEEQLYAECGQEEGTSGYLPLSLRKKISTKQDIASTEISYQFLAPKVLVLRRNEATNSSTSTHPFSAATKTLILGNLFKLVRFAITFARAVCHWG